MRRFAPKIGYPKKLVTPKNWLPQKIDLKRNGYPPKKCYPKKIDQKNGYPKKFGVLYCEGVYYCILEKWRTLLGFINAIQTLDTDLKSLLVIAYQHGRKFEETFDDEVGCLCRVR